VIRSASAVHPHGGHQVQVQLAEPLRIVQRRNIDCDFKR
jgi:hypothetical protein